MPVTVPATPLWRVRRSELLSLLCVHTTLPSRPDYTADASSENIPLYTYTLWDRKVDILANLVVLNGFIHDIREDFLKLPLHLLC